MNIISSILILMAAMLISGERTATNAGASEQHSYSDCVEKYSSAWGEDCAQCAVWKDSYVVYLKNICDESIDVMICVQEENRTWKRFQHTSMAPGDSLRAYACVGTGKYLAWGRRAGDESVVFPTMEEVERDYPE